MMLQIIIAIFVFSLLQGGLSQYTQAKYPDTLNNDQQCENKLDIMMNLLLQQQTEIINLRELINRKTEYVSFTANPSVSDLTTVNGERIIFNLTLNNIGQAYNPENGSFVCPRHGIYLFILNLYVKEGITTSVALYKDNQVVMRALAWAREIFRAHSGNTITVECLAGENLWLQATDNGRLHSGYSPDDNWKAARARRQTSWTGLALRYLD